MPKKTTTIAKKKTTAKVARKSAKKEAAKPLSKKAAVKKVSAKKTSAAPKATAKSTTATAKKTVSKKALKASSQGRTQKNSLVETVDTTTDTSKNITTSLSHKAVPKNVENLKKSHPADSKSTPIVFSLDDVEQLMASKRGQTAHPEKGTNQEAGSRVPANSAKKLIVEDKPVKQRVLGAASLADILGFNPAEKKRSTELSHNEIPQKWRKYYTLLIELRDNLSEEIDLHTSETLKHSSREDSGDLSGYSTHQADMGTDTFDRDFALSLVSSEQDALNEIDQAILRIKNGTYGICEVTGKAIPPARLAAVPFARYSVEGQAEYEKNMRRKIDRSISTSLFGDDNDASKLISNDDED